MPATDRDLCREAIRKTLSDLTGATPDASKVATATRSLLQEMADRLAPVIGVRGVDIILRRSLHLTHNTFPWITIPGGGEYRENTALLTSLQVRLAEAETKVAGEASYVVLVTFTELLATLIGESLTERLLEPVWMSTPPSAAKETIS